MASQFSAFFKENAKPIGTGKFAASERFLDADGKPLVWEFHAITAKQHSALRDSCKKRVGTNRAGQPVEKTDNGVYQAKMIAACVTFPDLSDKDLQENYGVASAEDLASVMLAPGEFDELFLEIFKFCGFKTDQEIVDETKN